jgi:hypothetical protein
MHSRKSGHGRGSAVPLWWRNALHAWEIALASPEVIVHRTARMAKAGHAPGVRDRKEFTRMGQEKLEALGESLIGMAMPLYTLNLELAALAARQS